MKDCILSVKLVFLKKLLIHRNNIGNRRKTAEDQHRHDKSVISIIIRIDDKMAYGMNRYRFDHGDLDVTRESGADPLISPHGCLIKSGSVKRTDIESDDILQSQEREWSVLNGALFFYLGDQTGDQTVGGLMVCRSLPT